jgi:hypothetical protein
MREDSLKSLDNQSPDRGTAQNCLDAPRYQNYEREMNGQNIHEHEPAQHDEGLRG